MAQRHKRIRVMAEHVLREHSVENPPVPVAKIARDLGLEVVRRGLEGDISGFLARHAGGGGLIGVNNRHPRPRQRFTVAHELGHYFLAPEEELHVDHQFEIFKLRDAHSAGGIDEEEIEANIFAAELLMPEFLLNRDLERLGALDPFDDGPVEELAKKYEVSRQALMIRIQNL